jgi:hypothetical protein
MTGIAKPHGTAPEAPAGSFRIEKGQVVVSLAKAAALRKAGAALALVDAARHLNLVVVHADRGLYVAVDRASLTNGAGGGAEKGLKAYTVRREGSKLLIDVSGARKL